MLRLLFSLKLIFLFYTIFLGCHLEKQKSQEVEKKKFVLVSRTLSLVTM